MYGNSSSRANKNGEQRERETNRKREHEITKLEESKITRQRARERAIETNIISWKREANNRDEYSSEQEGLSLSLSLLSFQN